MSLHYCKRRRVEEPPNPEEGIFTDELRNSFMETEVWSEDDDDLSLSLEERFKSLKRYNAVMRHHRWIRFKAMTEAIRSRWFWQRA